MRHPVFANWIEQRLEQLRPIDPRTVLIDPWRYETTDAIVIPTCSVAAGIPSTVRSLEAQDLALYETSQFEEGIESLVETFKAEPVSSTGIKIARILAAHIPTLNKLNLRSRFLNAYKTAFASVSGNLAPRLLEAALLFPPDVLEDEALTFAPMLRTNLPNTDAGATMLYLLLRKVLTVSTPATKAQLRQALHNTVAQLSPDSVLRGTIVPLVEVLTGYGNEWDRLRSSLLLLAHRLLVHREPHHRILDGIAEMSHSLAPTSIETFIGDDSSSQGIQYQARILCLADLHRALSALVELRELSDSGNTHRLLENLNSFFELRHNLRRSYHNGHRASGEIEQQCNALRHYLEDITELLKSPNPDKCATGVFDLLESRLLRPEVTLIRPIVERLQSGGLLVERHHSATAEETDWRILADRTACELIVDQLARNVIEYSHSSALLFQRAIVSYGVENRRFTLKVSNPTDDTEAAFKLRNGQTHRDLSGELHRYGGVFRGEFKGNELSTIVELEAI